MVRVQTPHENLQKSEATAPPCSRVLLQRPAAAISGQLLPWKADGGVPWEANSRHIGDSGCNGGAAEALEVE